MPLPLGRVSRRPFWYHATVSILIKTPLPALALIAIAGVRATRVARTEQIGFLLVPPAVVLVAATFDPSGAGIRRVLPVLPFLLTFAALACATPRPRWLSVLVLLLLAGLGGHRTAHPSAAARLPERDGGGQRSGAHVTDDSNVDWGRSCRAWRAGSASTWIRRIGYACSITGPRCRPPTASSPIPSIPPMSSPPARHLRDQHPLSGEVPPARSAGRRRHGLARQVRADRSHRLVHLRVSLRCGPRGIDAWRASECRRNDESMMLPWRRRDVTK